MKGIFITIEGPEGSGKSTLISRLVPYLEGMGRKVIATREPGGIAIAEEIRTLLHNPAHTAMDARTEALLYAAARRQHLTEKVIPALAAGYVVICDRFIDSSLAYQGYARGLGMEAILQVNQFATEGCMPQLTLYLDLDPAVGLERIQQDAAREINRLDMETLQFHLHVREGYRQVAELFPERIYTIDADRPLAAVAADAERILAAFI